MRLVRELVKRASQSTTKATVDRVSNNRMRFFSHSAAAVRHVARRHYSVATKDNNRRWHFGHVPYVITSDFEPGSSERSEVQTAIDRLNESDVNITLTPRENEPYFIEFRNADGSCSSPVGRVSHEGANAVACHVASSDFGPGSVIHEILHSLGFYHEQSRPDRDDHVEILEENIEEGKEHNFSKKSVADVVTPGSYDCLSIMHYGETAFGIPDDAGLKKTTIKVLDPSACPDIGQRDDLSSGDIAGVNELYVPLPEITAAESALLGSVWNQNEDGWTGIWTRRGDTCLFDALWTKGAEIERAVLRIRIDPATANVSIDRINTYYNFGPRFGSCSYSGVLDTSSGTASGTYECEWSTPKSWSASIASKLADDSVHSYSTSRSFKI